MNRACTRDHASSLLILLTCLAPAACRDSVPGENVEASAATPPPSREPAARRATAVELKLLPPRAVLGSDPDPGAPSLVFQAREKPEQLLGWFRATGNGADFVLESEMQEGAEHVFSGRVRATGQAYSVRIAPGANGGTTGAVVVADP